MKIEFNDLDVNLIIKENCDYEVVYLNHLDLGKVLQNSIFTEQHVYSYLEENLGNIKFNKSHSSKMVFIYNEVMDVSILTGLHYWLYRKPCNLDNVILVTTMNTGIKDWYNRYTNLLGVKGFKVIEAPLLCYVFLENFQSIRELDTRVVKKQLKHYFSLFGGTYFESEKIFLTVLFDSLKTGFVDLMFNPKDTTTSQLQNLDGYLEQLTNFSDRNTVDSFLQKFSELHICVDSTKTYNEVSSGKGFQYSINNCSAFQVVRETQHSLGYNVFTEKTLRSFVHLQMPIPVSGPNAVDRLKELGFVFDDTIIDYSYQYEPSFYNRALKVADMLKRVSEKYSLSDLEEYIFEKSEMLCYNYNYISSGQYLKMIKNNLIKSLHE